MRTWFVAGLTILSLTAGCDRAAVTYKPPFLPVKCAVGLRTVECKVEAAIVTQFGEFGVELDVFHTHKTGPNQQPDGLYILVIRHRTITGVVDTLYEIPADRELTLAGDGPFLVEFGHRRGFADVSNAQVTFLELRDPNSPQPTLQLGASPPPVLVPGTQRTGPTSKPPGQPPGGGVPTTSPPTQTAPPIPGTPTNVTAVAINSSTIRVSWTNHSDNTATLVVSNGNVSHAGLPPGTTTHDWGGLSPGTYMCFTVKAENVSGGSAWSAYGCTTVPQIPGTPTNVTAVAINSSTIRVSWTNHSDNTATLVVSNGNVSHAGLPPGTTTHDWGGLSPGTYMCFTVKAENVSGGSAWSAYGCTTTPSS